MVHNATAIGRPLPGGGGAGGGRGWDESVASSVVASEGMVLDGSRVKEPWVTMVVASG